jgi:hypothetical protein
MDLLAPIDIFISYRRTDTKAVSRLIFEELCRRFGREHVLFDVDRIPLGAEHHRHLAEQVARCSVVLVVVGDRWAEGPRAFTDDDLVRIEVRAALEAGIPILPILADGAALPLASDALDLLQPLLRRPALPVDSGRDFAQHMIAICREVEHLAREYRNEPSQSIEGRSAPTLSHAPVATATLPPVEKRTESASRRWLVASIWLGAAAAAALSLLHFTSRNAAPSTAPAHAALALVTAAEKTAPATLSIQVSVSPAEAALYLDGQRLPSNPYVGRIAGDGAQHLLRAVAPGYASTDRAFVANREVAIIVALARTGDEPHAEIKKVHPAALPSPAPAPAAPAPVEPTVSTPDDCKRSPYYIDDRNIKVVRPECLRAIQSP